MSEWPSREQFLKSRSGPYFDRVFITCSTTVRDYATPEEIATLRRELKAQYRELGRDLREINSKLPAATKRRYVSDEHRQERFEASRRRHCRHAINKVLRALDDGVLPDRQWVSYPYYDKVPLLAVIYGRYEAAYEAALVVCWAKLDEEDWQRELKRRARIEAAVESAS